MDASYESCVWFCCCRKFGIKWTLRHFWSWNNFGRKSVISLFFAFSKYHLTIKIAIKDYLKVLIYLLQFQLPVVPFSIYRFQHIDISWLDKNVKLASKLHVFNFLNLKMFLNNVLSQYLIVKCISKSLLLIIIIFNSSSGFEKGYV